MENLVMQSLFSGIYKDKTVLVTGHTGFKGSWLCFWLKKMGANVIGYALEAPTTPNHFELLNLDIISITGNIKDLEHLNTVFQTYKPDIVFHLAAQPLVRLSYENPIETYETNVIGTLKVFEACRNNNTKAIVNITSDKAYENKEWIWGYKEIAKPNNLPQPTTSTIPKPPKSEIKHDVHGDYFTVNIADPTKNDNTISYGSLVGAKPEGYKVTRNHFPAVAQNFRQKYVILHYTALDHDKSVRVLTTQAVSSHYLVNDSTDIEIYQLVDENKRSYHAGISSLIGRSTRSPSTKTSILVRVKRAISPSSR
jgi:hypothetical protein